MGIQYQGSPGAVFGPSGANHSQGMVPDPGSTAGTTRVLYENATWGLPYGVRLNTLTPTGVSSSADTTSFANSSYTNFRLLGRGIQFNTTAVNLLLLFSTNGGSSYDNTSGHYALPLLSLTSSASSSNGFTARAGVNNNTIASSGILVFDINVFDPANASNNCFVQGQASYTNSTGPTHESCIFAGQYTFATGVNAFQFSVSAGIFTGIIEVFGIA